MGGLGGFMVINGWFLGGFGGPDSDFELIMVKK
jgi:hypothetical protein